MNNLETVRTLILAIGWPVLIVGSVYLFMKGSSVYRMVKGSLVGRITNILVVSMLVGMYSLGIITTAYMFENVNSGVLLGAPIFLVWFVMFVWAMKTLVSASNEVHKLSE